MVLLEKEVILSWRGMVVVWLQIKARGCVSPPNTARVQNMLSALLLMTAFLYLELRKWIYRVWETVKLLQCKSFCLWEGKVHQEELRNQRIKAYMIKYNCTIGFYCIYHCNNHVHQIIDFHIYEVSTPQSMKLTKGKKLDLKVFLNEILIAIFTAWVVQIWLENNKILLFFHFCIFLECQSLENWILLSFVELNKW